MERKRELCQQEDAAWVELWRILDALSPEQIERPGYFDEGWSVKDLMTHIGCWQAETVQVLEQIRFDTFDHPSVDVEEMNRRFSEATRDFTVDLAWVELWSARTRMLQEWSALPQVTADAEEWFFESGANHYAEHLPRLRQWAEELVAS